MNAYEAQQEAVRRWGPWGLARDRSSWGMTPPFVVGVRNACGNLLVAGEGTSWEEAFAEADTRKEFLRPYLETPSV